MQDDKPIDEGRLGGLDFRKRELVSGFQEQDVESIEESSSTMKIRQAAPWDNGVYIMGLGQGNGHSTPVHFLVDTGAAVSVMSLTTYDHLPQEILPPLKPTNVQIAGVTDDSLDIAGLAKMTLVFNGILIVHDVLIVDIPVEAILGQDIHLEHQGEVGLANLISCHAGSQARVP